MRAKIGLTALAVAIVLAASCTLSRGDRIVTVREVLANVDAMRGTQVRLRGRGVIMAANLLCPGHVGLDTRVQFWDAEGNMMAAMVTMPLPGDDRQEGMQLPIYIAVVRVFEGDEGCPGQVTRQRIPYLEVTGMMAP